ncbi:MAG: hypothetical protein CVU55_06700 [Deltaproteobacteria bacterium HGW-Deltaproteobacteria-13]|jgi:tetratricopeptide (TPR) repeat protein|nr:MAG: hypothetical protein CVU55_06700 [Deltaproteobacteria bacterium HGW-Deltaproteobacteria-13]
MSYINDALLKAQKDKKSPYAAYEPILSASGKKTGRPRKWLPITVIILCILWAAGMIVFLNGHENLLNRSLKKKMPAATPLIVATVPAAVPVQPQIIEKTATDNKSDAGLKAKTRPAAIKAGTEIAESKILYEQAFKKQQAGNLDEARDLYRKVLKIDPQNVQALNNLGVIHMNTKYYKKAILRFNDAIHIKHDYTDAHYNLACLYAQKNNARQSLFYLDKAVHLNPQVRKWAANDADLKVLSDLPEFKKLLEK